MAEEDVRLRLCLALIRSEREGVVPLTLFANAEEGSEPRR